MKRCASTRSVFYGISPAHKQKQESRLRKAQHSPQRDSRRIVNTPRVTPRNHRYLSLSNSIEPSDFRPDLWTDGNHRIRRVPCHSISDDVLRDVQAIPSHEVLKPPQSDLYAQDSAIVCLNNDWPVDASADSRILNPSQSM